MDMLGDVRDMVREGGSPNRRSAGAFMEVCQRRRRRATREVCTVIAARARTADMAAAAPRGDVPRRRLFRRGVPVFWVAASEKGPGSPTRTPV